LYHIYLIMKLTHFKILLEQLPELDFILPNGHKVPLHFHITEISQITKKFIDCGGKVRLENTIGFQLWENTDMNHRLSPKKLLNIIDLAEKKLDLKDAEIEVEYQGDTIGKYNLSIENGVFQLLKTKTACLAEDQCVVPPEKTKIKLSDISVSNDCTPGSGCC